MEFIKTSIPGCLVIKPDIHEDARGTFVKTFNADIFVKTGLETVFVEDFFTVSKNRTLRGLHFQMPPHELKKIVHCISGRIFDAVLDLRINSPAYGRWEIFELSSDNNLVLYIPEGIAHGFYSMTHNAVTAYKTTRVHSKTDDAGIYWNSAGIPWPDEDPVISERDRNLPRFENFTSPFFYGKGGI